MAGMWEQIKETAHYMIPPKYRGDKPTEPVAPQVNLAIMNSDPVKNDICQEHINAAKASFKNPLDIVNNAITSAAAESGVHCKINVENLSNSRGH